MNNHGINRNLRGVSLAFFLMLLAAAVLLIWAWALARPDLVERTGELPEVRRLLTPLRAPATA